MNKNRKILRVVIGFMLFVPFRLPISMLLIMAFNGSAQLLGEIPKEVLIPNVVVSKIIYNLIVSTYFLYGVEKLSREMLGRVPFNVYGEENPRTVFYWTGIVIVLSCGFIAFDIYSTITLLNLTQ